MKKLICKIIFIFIGLVWSFGTAWSQSSRELKVMSFNIRSMEDTEFKVEPFAKLINKYKLDFIALQEVEIETNRMGDRDLVTELGEATAMFPLFAKAYDKESGKYGVAILSRFPIVESYNQLLPMADGSDQRVILVTKIMLPDNQMVKFVDVHLDHKTSFEGQKQQAKVLYSQEILESDSQIPLLLAGDFNTHIGSPLYETLMKSYIRMCDNSGTFHGGSKLDYIFAYPPKRWESLKSEVLREAESLSDHYPLLTTIKLLNP